MSSGCGPACSGFVWTLSQSPKGISDHPLPNFPNSRALFPSILFPGFPSPATTAARHRQPGMQRENKIHKAGWEMVRYVEWLMLTEPFLAILPCP